MPYWSQCTCIYGAFSYLVNTKQLPTKASDFKAKLILTYPNDDDAVLFGYHQIVDKYGWNRLREVHERPRAVERFRSQVELYFGQVKGADPGDPGGTLGRTPGAF
ncbi:hypothetical protein AB0H86_31015 [Streptomyces sp. NPDC050997]|uniref:hypothetical protein n=1 Tax=Streptomyces sp. NPDC050997 TaxID=3155519 RepID=UPI00341EEA89